MEQKSEERALIVEGGKGGSLLNKLSGKTWYRLWIFMLSGLLPFGAYFGYDSIAAVSTYLEEDGGFTRSQIGALYSAYSLPNLIMVFIGGFLIDKIGTNRMTLIFSVLINIGALIVASSSSFYIMLIGRFFFGMGSESTMVAQSTILANWFSSNDDNISSSSKDSQSQSSSNKQSGKEMALAFGGALTLGRAGSFTAIIFLSWIADLTNSFHWPLWIVLFICTCCFVLNLILNIFNIHGGIPQKVYHPDHSQYNINNKQETMLNKIKRLVYEMIADLKPIIRFPKTFWLIGAVCFCTYGTVFTFATFSIDYLHTEWGYSKTHSSRIASIITISSMIFSPIFGFLIDKVGRRVSIMILGQLLLIPCMIAMGWSGVSHPDTSSSSSSTSSFEIDNDLWYPSISYDGWIRTMGPYPWIVIIGFAYSLVPAAMWPCVPLVIDKRFVGIAFGMLTACQNSSGVVVPAVLGAIRDGTGNYLIGHLILAGLACCGASFCILLRWETWRQGDYLESPSGKRPYEDLTVLE